MRRFDVVALLVGVVCCTTALLAVLILTGRQIDWGIVQVAAPITLVAIGVLGLVLDRGRH